VAGDRGWLLALAGTIFLLALIPYVHHSGPAGESIEIEEVGFARGRYDGAVLSRTLPDDWYLHGPGLDHGWYRVRIEIEKPQNLWAVYLPSVSMNAAVYLNGQPLANGGNPGAAVARNWNRPLLFPISPALFVSGSNLVEIRVAADPPGSGLLGRFYIGPNSVLAPAYRFRTIWKVGVVWAITIGLVLLSLFMAALWVLRRQETIFGWFAAVGLIWATHNLNVLIVHIPVSSWQWDLTTRFGCLQWFVIVSVIFINRYLQEPQPRLERGICYGGVVAMLVFALCPAEYAYSFARHVWDPLILCGGLFAAQRLVGAYRREPGPEIRGLLVSASTLVVFGARDALTMNHLWDREHGFYLQYGAPVVLVVFAWILMRRFVTALNRAEELNVELEQRVEFKRRELERTYLKLQAFERERILNEERERIMRDMHDGVAGHLVSTLALVERRGKGLHDIGDCLRRALTDLRLMIDSLDTAASDLSTMLGMLRERLAARIRATGIDVRWQVEALPVDPSFGPQKSLHVTRIVQEAITNVLKHANASSLTLHAAYEKIPGNGRIVIEVCDDGDGIAVCAAEGRGLPNMRHRASSIGAQIEMRRTAQGTCVRLTLPVLPSERVS
jgi:signal transduction histidine kinase